MGVLEPSPTGSYYNPARYAGQGFSQRELNRIQRNLDNVYNQDVQYNRVANPRFQTEQDTGYSSNAPFGSGRASAATTQQYAQAYGRPAGNGLTTFDTPSGGSITYRPSGRQLSGGVPNGGAQPPSLPTLSSNALNKIQPYNIAPNPFAGQLNQGSGLQFGTPSTTTSNLPNSYQFGQQVSRGIADVGIGAANAFTAARNAIGVPAYNFFAGMAGAQPTQPRRYFDF